MKKSLIFGFIAVLSAALLFTGCSQATDSAGTTSISIGGWLVDFEVDTEQELLDAFENDDYKVIGVVGSGSTLKIGYKTGSALSDLNVIPADKTVVLFTEVTPGPTLTVEGKLIVEGGGNLAASFGAAEVAVTPTGQIQVINGTLTVNGPAAVHGSPYDDEIFGTPRLVFAGGTLAISGPTATFADVKEALTWVPHGQVTIANLIEPIKPSVLTKIQPQTTAVRRLTITAKLASSLETIETETELIVPPGLTFTTDDPLLTVTKLDVRGNLTLNEAFLARITDLTVSGTLAATKATYSKVKTLTVNSSFLVPTASFPALEDLIVSSGGAFTGSTLGTADSENGIGLAIAPKGSVTVTQINSLRTSTIQGSLTATGFTPYAPTPALTDPSQLRVAPGGSINGINFPEQVIVTALGDVNSVTIDDFTVPEDQGLIIPALKTLVIGAGKTLTYDGQVTIAATGNLVLATGTASVGKILGTGSITAGVTTINGAWEAVGADGGKVTILSAATGATIAATAPATGLKASAAGAKITQGALASNNLVIAADTTIDLAGTDAAAVGKLILTGSATPANVGSVQLAVTNGIIKAGANPSLTTAYSNGAKIGDKAVTKGTNTSLYTVANTDAPGKFGGIKTATSADTLTAGTDTVEIDSTQDVTT
ncbi:hypothetical protein LQZ21_11665 [Treponema sp. TIM-1]|uniref:hypothetical protein n=1 Tax=Treponema sp. TIM-1 TaxID=2898417 RepID=UPI0039816257